MRCGESLQMHRYTQQRGGASRMAQNLHRNIGKKLMIFIVLKWNNNFNAYRGNVKLKLKFVD